MIVQHYLTSMSELSSPRCCEEEDAGNQAPAAAAILQRAPLPAIIFQEDNCVTTNIGPTPIHHHILKLSVASSEGEFGS